MNPELERLVQAQLNWERARHVPLGVGVFLLIGLPVAFFAYWLFGYAAKTFGW